MLFHSVIYNSVDPHYNVHFSYNYLQCKPNAPIYPYSADRGSGVVFAIASGFLSQKTDFIEFSINYTLHDYGSQCYQKTDLVKTKEVVVNSVWIYILCYRVQTEQREVGRVLPTDNEGGE